MRLNKITRVLISVTDKAGIVEFARGLADFNVEILSTGGTAAQIRNSGLKVTDVSEYTGFPEMMDGRLKTLHPKSSRRTAGPARQCGTHESPPGPRDRADRHGGG